MSQARDAELSFMKHYEGSRTIDGIRVTVNGTPLDPRYDLAVFTRLGFEWSYEGDAPRQLSLALIAHAVGEDLALQWSKPFMTRVVLCLDNDWQLTDDDIRKTLETMSVSHTTV